MDIPQNHVTQEQIKEGARQVLNTFRYCGFLIQSRKKISMLSWTNNRFNVLQNSVGFLGIARWKKIITR